MSATTPPTAETAPRSLTVAEAVALSLDALRRGDRTTAAHLAELVRRADPENPLARSAAALATEAAGTEPPVDCGATENAASAWFSLARRKAAAGDHGGAIRAFEQATILKPARCFDWNFMGESLLADGRLNAALAAFLRCLRLNRHNYPAAHRYADLLGLFGRWREAAAATRYALAVAPGSCEMLLLLGMADMTTCRFDEAERAFRRALSVNPQKISAAAGLAEALRAQGRLAEALPHAAAAAAAEPDKQLYLLSAALCGLHLEQGGIPAFNVDLARRLATVARTAEQRGDFAAAADCWSRALHAVPNAADVAAAGLENLTRWKAALRDDPRPPEQRNPDWVMIECRTAETVYLPAMAHDRRWSGSVAPRPARRRPKIWDTCMFFNEYDMLHLRLAELDGVADRFIVVESPWTHQHKAKPLHFAEARERYAAFDDRIVHVVADERRDGLTWDQESYQRNCVLKGLADADDDDLALICDVDEIPRRQVVRDVADDPERAARINALSVTNYNYFLNFASYQPCIRPIIAPVGLLRRGGPNLARHLTVRSGSHLVPVIPEAGWHFSWFGGIEAVLRKLGYFCHIELIKDMPTPEELARRFAAGDFQLLRQKLEGAFVPIDHTFPDEVRNNMQLYRDLGWIWLPDGASPPPADGVNRRT